MFRVFTLFAFVASTLASISSASAIEYGFIAFDCIEIESSIFEKEADGTGNSCAVFNRKRVAENRAVRNLEADADRVCEEIRDVNPSFYDAYCDLVCEYNGYEESTGIGVCDYVITDEDAWSEQGCVSGRRQYHRKEADVQCGCNCRTRL